MISLKDWMEAVDYRITEGSAYCWQCYGPNAYTLDSWDQDHDGVSASIVFDTKTQEVYQADVHDYSRDRSYRLINPSFKQAHDAEGKERDVNFDEAYDGVKFVDLETEEDFLDKLTAIMNYEEYDTRVSVPLEFSDAELLRYMTLAHERDMTFNEFVEEALRQGLEEFNRDPEAYKQRMKEFVNE